MLYNEGLVVLGRGLSVFADDYYVRITVQSKTPFKSLLLCLLFFPHILILRKIMSLSLLSVEAGGCNCAIAGWLHAHVRARSCWTHS
jgi:hypothetical protein